jgi:RND family efflux transporter MFP subunit
MNGDSNRLNENGPRGLPGPQRPPADQSEGNASAVPAESHGLRARDGSRPRRRLDWRLIAVAALGLTLVPVWRARTSHAEPRQTVPPALQVAVARVERQDLSQELVCDAEFRPYQEVDLHAKVAGYLESINVDIGDRVKPGQLLATIEVPELADDIRRAEAAQKRNAQEVARAQVAWDDAHLVYSRLSAIAKTQPSLIAQQDLDSALEKDQAAGSALAAAQAEVEVAKAELEKLQTMLKYCRISAPFAGVITERYADPGALIQAGTASSTQTLPIVRLSQNDRLRLDIPVSVSYVSGIKNGDPVAVHVAALEKPFEASIARTSGKVDTATRTMKVEVDVPNPDLKLIPGMYASVALRLDHRDKTLAIPVEAVSRQKACTVFVVNPQNIIEERTVSLGLETPRKYEVLTGLRENELVMIGSRTQVKPGQRVGTKLLEEVGNPGDE